MRARRSAASRRVRRTAAWRPSIGTQSSTALRDALTPYYRRERSQDRLRLIDVAGMAHNWTADERAVAELRRTIAAWYRRYR